MRILMPAPLYHPYMGGAETHTRTLAEALIQAGQQVTVLTDRGHLPVPAAQELNGVRIRRTGGVREEAGRPDQVRWEADVFGLLSAAERALDGEPRPDVIHAQCQISFLLGAVLKEQWSVPLVVTPHETTPENDGLGRGRTRLLFTLPQIDLFIAGSRTFAEQAFALGRTPADTTVIASPVHMPPLERMPDPEPVVLAIGRFKPRKNQLALLEAVALLRRRGRRLRCVLAGSCDAASVDYRAALVARAQLPDLAGAVEIHDRPDGAVLRRLLGRAGLVLHPSLAEGLGLVMIEAITAGCPVLATPTDGARELFGDTPSLLTAGFAPDAIAAAIAGFLDHPDRYATDLTAARKLIQDRFDPARSAARTLAVYHRLTGASR